MISTKGRYALRLMIDMGIHSEGSYIKLKDVSEREDISIKYLEQVVALLVRAGLVISLRGNNGGYRLSKETKDYTIGEIIIAAEGTLAPVACLQCAENICARKANCSTIEFWTEFNDVVNNFVNSKTLADLCEQAKKKSSDYSI